MVVVADCNNHRLALWRLGDGTVWKHLGSEGTEPGQFTEPQTVAVTGTGALVVTDQRGVQVLSVDGAVLCVLDPTAMVAGVGRLGIYLFGVAVYPGTDEILVTDYDNHRVVALSWSPEVCCSVMSIVAYWPPPVFQWRLYRPSDGVLFSFFCVSSVDYWMQKHLAAKAHNWVNSTVLVVLQSHQREMCVWQIRQINGW